MTNSVALTPEELLKTCHLNSKQIDRYTHTHKHTTKRQFHTIYILTFKEHILVVSLRSTGILTFASVSSCIDFVMVLGLSRAVSHFRKSVWGRRRQGGDSAAGFPKTAFIIGGTSDFVPRWQMVSWGAIQGGRFTFIVQAHKLHIETIVSVRGREPALGGITFPFIARRMEAEINFIPPQM